MRLGTRQLDLDDVCPPDDCSCHRRFDVDGTPHMTWCEQARRLSKRTCRLCHEKLRRATVRVYKGSTAFTYVHEQCFHDYWKGLSSEETLIEIVRQIRGLFGSRLEVDWGYEKFKSVLIQIRLPVAYKNKWKIVEYRSDGIWHLTRLCPVVVHKLLTTLDQPIEVEVE